MFGEQSSDEGKGKATDLLGDQVDYVLCYQGGNNTEHTVVIGDQKYAGHSPLDEQQDNRTLEHPWILVELC